MLHVEDPRVKALLFQGNFGLEKESLRVDGDGYLAHTPHPFPEDDHIVRDFCENQVEINTPVAKSASEAVDSLADYHRQILKRLHTLSPREYLWPFSSPPHIRNEADIPIAQFAGGKASKTGYRQYLSDRYGRYKMAFSGIHVNFSFGKELMEQDFAVSGEKNFRAYQDRLYLDLAERAAAYGWILVSATAASPLLDSSFVEKGHFGGDTFMGMASVRCSEMGYWNAFAPVFDYSSIEAYADSIQQYVDEGFLKAPSELYYPIRLKPKGLNRLDTLREKGVDHIELRMFDLNPLAEAGVEKKDVLFAQLLLIWLAGTPRQPFSLRDQVQAVQNFKNAAHYDLKTVKIVVPNGEVYSVAHAALNVISFMKAFYKDFPQWVQDVLLFEEAKFIDPENRYAWKIRHAYVPGFAAKGLELAKRRQEEANV